jgi:drug/metabolite transporter (DMT)-like permease
LARIGYGSRAARTRRIRVLMQRWRADLALLGVVIIWGASFLVVHDTAQRVAALGVIALRFSLAALVVSPLGWRERKQLDRRGARFGVLLGLVLFVSFWAQTEGIARTTPARSGFLTGLCVVLVPVLSRIFFRQTQTRGTWLGVGLAALGLVLLAAGGDLAGGSWFGDLLVVGCAVTFAWHLIAIERWGKGRPAMALNAIQLATAAVVGWVAWICEGSAAWPASRDWLALFYLGTLSTALAYGVQLWAQRHTSATHTALIFALEPVFAALFSVFLGGEVLSVWLLSGGGALVSGVLCAELFARRS